MKDLIIFDLDGTLAESKAAIDKDMALLINLLLKVKKVAIISGGDWPQFQKQVLSQLKDEGTFSQLFILPTCGTKYYEYKEDWELLYNEKFSSDQKEKIITSLKEALKKTNTQVAETWGEQIEDRGSQITFSALGQKAPLEEKEKWDPEFKKRKKIKNVLDQSIPEFSVRLGGTTSVDITRPGIDKAYGINKLKEELGIPFNKMMFIGDAIFPDGNDYAAWEAGLASICVKDPAETKNVICTIIACLSQEIPPLFNQPSTT